MNFIEMVKEKKNILKCNKIIICNKCKEQYFSTFDKLYINVKGTCFVCDEDQLLADNIFNIL